MKLHTETSSGVLKISGSIHTDAVAPLRTALLGMLSTQPEIVLDLSEVDMCDTPALQVLFSCRASAASLGKPFRVAASPFVIETIEALGLPSTMLTDAIVKGSHRGT